MAALRIATLPVASPPVGLSFNEDGLAVLTRELGATTDVLTLTETFSAGIADRVAAAGPEDAWLAVILSVAESLADQLVEFRQVRTNTVH